MPIAFLDALTTCKTRVEVLEVYAIWAARLMQADRCSVTLRSTDEWLMITATDGAETHPQRTHHPIQNSTVGAVFRQQEPLLLQDVGLIDLADAQIVNDLGFRSAVLMPIIGGTECFGTLSASYRQTLSKPAAQLAMIGALARCLATQLLIIDQMENLTAMARTDALTGAGNRYELYAQAEGVWDAWAKDARLFSYLCMDVDHFKQINDTYGHDIGDAVLCAFVKRVQCQLRATDSIIRTGGEEFGMLMPETDLSSAIMRCQRLCDVIGNSPFAVQNAELTITASFGVTQVIRSDQSFNDVMKRADIALYEAKAAGRDQVVSIDKSDLAA